LDSHIRLLDASLCTQRSSLDLLFVKFAQTMKIYLHGLSVEIPLKLYCGKSNQKEFSIFSVDYNMVFHNSGIFGRKGLLMIDNEFSLDFQ
jgi:hypothetical protein